MLVLTNNSQVNKLTISIVSSLVSGFNYSLKNYSANDVALLVQVDGNVATEINTSLPLPLAVLNKYNGVNQPTMTLYWNGTTMMLV
jgi:hypothetical protein